MSVRLDTTPWFTKNLAAGRLDTSVSSGHGGGRTGGWYRTGATPGRTGRPRIIVGMLLALDVGNTNITIGLFRAGALLATRRAATNQRATADELELLLDGLLRLDGIAMADLDAIAIASVVPSVSAAVEAIADRCGIGPATA